MTDKPLVSIITPTWQRHETLMQRAIPSVIGQTYSNIEHIIVSDGLDMAFEGVLCEDFCKLAHNPHGYHEYIGARTDEDTTPCSFYELGRNSSSLVPDSHAIAPVMVGMWLARGTYLTWLADDDVMSPTLLDECVTYLEDEPNIGFVYTAHRHRTPTRVYDVYGVPPTKGAFANVVFRADLLRFGGFQMFDGYDADWKMVERWLRNDVEWGFIDKVLFEHFADH